jgi:hypothetical protein
MRKIILPALLLGLLSCNETGTSDELGAVKPVDDSVTTTAADLDYAYTRTNKSNYVMGDPAQIQMVLNSLKAFETNNNDALFNNFGDNDELRFDKLHAKFIRDRAKTILANSRGRYESYNINMHDWETVKSTNTDDEWVSLWYTEVYKEKGGKLDSINIMDDVKIKDGKIIEISGYIRRFPTKK